MIEQASLAALFYVAVVVIFRLAGKRLAGQTTTFDLIVLISISVALQQATLRDGSTNTVIFIGIVFILHWLNAKVCVRFPRLRNWLRGSPCQLVRNGEILYSSLRSEGMSVDELQAGLRKVGINEISEVQSAHLEETGHISAIKKS